MQIVGSVDYPAVGATLGAGEFYLGGWVFMTSDGKVPSALFVGYEEVGGQGRRIICQQMTLYAGVARQDVYDAFHPSCPPVTPNSGYNITLTPPPAGVWKIVTSWADPGSGASWNDMRTVTILP